MVSTFESLLTEMMLYPRLQDLVTRFSTIESQHCSWYVMMMEGHSHKFNHKLREESKGQSKGHGIDDTARSAASFQVLTRRL